MEITVNQQDHKLHEACSIEQMLSILHSGDTKGIAVAVNQSVVAKSDWSVYQLKDGDDVILIKATQGG